MRNKSEKAALGLATNMCRDAIGNVITGNELRSLGYLKALVRTLEALSVKVEAGNDVRAEMTLDLKIKRILVQLDVEHGKAPFCGDQVAESIKKYASVGYTLSEIIEGPDTDLKHVDELLKSAT